MVKQAIKWISQAKKFMYEAQMGIKDFTQDIEKEFSPLGENLTSEFNPKTWASSFSPEGGAISSNGFSDGPERIKLDTREESYTKIIDWKETITLDLDPKHYDKIVDHKIGEAKELASQK